jgi:hypothetical protein
MWKFPRTYGRWHAAVLLPILVAGLVSIAGLISWISYRRVYNTQFSLVVISARIVRFEQVNARYPRSLSELQSELPKEYLSRLGGDATEYHELNGRGGWYYDPNTGSVHVNLQRPVREYLHLYLGRDKDEIPSEWEKRLGERGQPASKKASGDARPTPWAARR